MAYYNEKQLKRIKQQEKFYPCFTNMTVIDIGCNSGYVTEKISEYAKKVYGIDDKLKNKDTDKVTYFNKGIKDFLKFNYDFNAINAVNVLYYLTEEELELIEKQFPKCDIVIMGSSEKKNDSGEFNKRGLSKWVNINNWLLKNEFRTKIYFKDTDWVTVIGF